MNLETIADLIRESASARPENPAFYVSDQNRSGSEPEFTPISWRQFARDIRVVAKHLSAVSTKRGERIALLCPNCYAWEVVEKAALMAGLMVVGIDTHATAADVNRMLKHSRADHLFVDDDRLMATLDPSRLSAIKSVIVRRKGEALPERGAQYGDVVEKSGEDFVPEPGSCRDDAMMIFTSGTTGVPKAIVYSQRQMLAASREIRKRYGVHLDREDRSLCWLPLSNLYQRIVNLFAMLQGMPIYIVNDPRQLDTMVQVVNPAFLAGVPRFFEKREAAVLERVERCGFPLKAVVRSSMALARRYVIGSQNRAWYRGLLRLPYRMAKALVLDRITHATFGRSLKFLISGSAQCPVRIIEWFARLGIPLYEAYGISENITPIAMNGPGAWKIGSVGKPCPEHSIRIMSDGQIEVKGPGMFGGYVGEGGNVASRGDAYHRTSDYGYLDPDGYLFLTGRQSEILKTSTGRKVAVLPLEAELNRLPHVNQSLVMGNERKHLTALLAVEAEPNECENDNRMHLLDRMARALEEFNNRQAAHSRIPGALVLFRPLSIGKGELTTNQKIRRTFLGEKFNREVAELYRAIEEGAVGAVGNLWGEGPLLLVARDSQ